VTRVPVLLDFYLVSRNLQWNCQEHDGRVLIEIASAQHPLVASIPFAPEHFRHLTFYVPAARPVIVRFTSQRTLPYKRNPPDHTGCESITLL
jgi:hypothetical protein